MNSDTTTERSQHSSGEKFIATSKEFRFPKVWLSYSKQIDVMKRNPNLHLRQSYKRCSSNSSCETNSSSASRTSEITFGCDKQIEISKKSSQSQSKNTYIDGNFVEFNVLESQQRYKGRPCSINRTKLVDRHTQTDFSWRSLFTSKTYFVLLIILLMSIISGVTYITYKNDQENSNYLYYNKFSRPDKKHTYYTGNSPSQNKKQVLSTGTALDIMKKKTSDYGNSDQSDDFVKLCQNMNDAMLQIQSKLIAVEKEVALFQQNDFNQKQMDDLVYGHLYGSAADYALEAIGGSIIDTPGTVTYSPSAVTVTLFGISIWKHIASHPRIIIKGAIQPGQCWSFHGSEGRVIIQLAFPIRISAIALEHYPWHLLPTSRDILSAPKHFSVTGFFDCTDCSENEEKLNLGSFEYQKGGPSRQVFYVHQELLSKKGPVQRVEFHFKTNHGNPDYTCVYRVRVHGKVESNL